MGHDGSAGLLRLGPLGESELDRDGGASLRAPDRGIQVHWPQIRERMARLGIEPADVLDEA